MFRLYDGQNLFYIILFIVSLTMFLAIIINLSRLPNKYILSNEFFDLDGRPKAIPIELYTKKTKENTKLGKLGEAPKKRKKNKKKIFKHEEECRRIFEKIFKEEFPSLHPEWLVNPITGSILELDMYCVKLKLACEYDGAQHAGFVPKFHKNEIQASYQQTKDREKDRICKEKGVDLIRVPHWIKYEKLEDYITGELKKIGRII